VVLTGDLATEIDANLHHRFMAAWFAHLTSYATGIQGGGFVCFRVWRERGYPWKIALAPRSGQAMIRTVLLAALVAAVWWIRFGR
jgi:hypothetical protein